MSPPVITNMKAYIKAEIELKMMLNKKIYEQDIITNEMYEKAIDLIYKQYDLSDLYEFDN